MSFVVISGLPEKKFTQTDDTDFSPDSRDLQDFQLADLLLTDSFFIR
jgi:hypothetical protein